MVFSALEATGSVPFYDVYVHGLVKRFPGKKDEQIPRKRYRPAGDNR